MKLLKLAICFLFLATITSCVTTMPLNQQFYNSKKVGVIVQVDSIGMARVGGQGLLDVALTSGNRFSEPLKQIEPKFNLQEKMEAEVAAILKSKNKQFQFITETVNYTALDKFEKPNSDKKYSKRDFRKLIATNNVDEILYVKVKYGILVSYYGMIELDKQGYTNITSELVDLSDNSLLGLETFQTATKMQGNWKKGDDYANLTNAIQEAIDKSLVTFKTKF